MRFDLAINIKIDSLKLFRGLSIRTPSQFGEVACVCLSMMIALIFHFSTIINFTFVFIVTSIFVPVGLFAVWHWYIKHDLKRVRINLTRFQKFK